MSKHSLKPEHGKDLHPAHVQKLVTLQEQRRDEVDAYLEERRRALEALTAGEVSEDEGGLPTEFSFPDRIIDLQPDDFRRGRKGRGRNRGGNQGGNRNGGNKGGNHGGNGGGRRPAPSPQTVLTEVQRILSPLPRATNNGNIQLGEFNGQFLDKLLASTYIDSYKELLARFHVMLMEEVGQDGIDYLKQATGYNGVYTQENTRHQAVAIMWSDRMQLVNGPVIYNDIATVQGIPDLRPALRVDLKDKVSGKVFSFVVLHLKSMRGGPAVTAVVRSKQFALLVKDLGNDFEGIVGGDLNFIIDDPNNKDAEPMYQAGFKLVAPNDHSATQIIGSRIDGFFAKGLSVGVDFYRVFAFFATLGRSFSDHGATKCELLVASNKSNQDAQGSASSGIVLQPTDGDDSDEQPFVLRVQRVAAGAAPSKRKATKKSK